jgi:hypothetical protein
VHRHGANRHLRVAVACACGRQGQREAHGAFATMTRSHLD